MFWVLLAYIIISLDTLFKNGQYKKSCEIQAGGQEMAVMVGWWYIQNPIKYMSSKMHNCILGDIYIRKPQASSQSILIE